MGRGLYARYCGFSRGAKFLIKAQLINQLGGALYGFILVLYLDALGHSPTLFGSLMLVNELAMVAVLLGAGILADRYGKKNILLFGIATNIIGMLILVLTEVTGLFFVSSFLVGIGGGMIGPAFGAWLAEKCKTKRRKYLFSLNSMAGLMGSGSMTILAGLIPLFFIDFFRFGDLEAYRMVFVIAILLQFLAAFLFTRIKKDHVTPREKDRQGNVLKRPWGLILKFSLPQAMVGIGAGLFVPYFQLFFLYKFDLDLSEIGIIFAILSFTMVAITYILPRIAEKGGTVLTVVSFHVSSIFALLLIPIVPWLGIVIYLFVFRAAMMNVPHPIFTAFMHSKVPHSFRATAQSSMAFAWMVTHAVGVFIGGFLWIEGSNYAFPFYLGSIFYIISIFMYIAFFFKMDDKKHKRFFRRPLLQNIYNR